jgi:hypothetical protein
MSLPFVLNVENDEILGKKRYSFRFFWYLVFLSSGGYL